MKKSLFILFVLFVLSINKETKASHLTAIDLFYTHIQGDSFRINLVLYRDCSGIPFGNSVNVRINSLICNQSFSISLTLDSSSEVSQLCPNQLAQSSCNGGGLPGVQGYSY